MRDIIKSFFSRTASPADQRAGEGHDVRVAACALLLEMAHVDGEFDDDEREKIVAILKGHFGLTDEDADEIMQTARAELEGSIDLWRFTHLINENYSVEEKIHIIELVWKVAFTDTRLDKHEDHLAHRMAELLNLNHKQLIDAKLKVKDSLR
ncbi:MAG TPA: TerB family tellurite resistance protein [Synergistetes bacterium]|nr:TerB family tellurite resistance protein [Synergistota bacterium]